MSSYKPPAASAGQCRGVPFDKAPDIAPQNKAAFDAFDKTTAGKKDPNNCEALLQFPDGQIFWSSKMAIDADGPAAGPGRLSGTQLDVDSGQDDTSYHFPGTNKALSSELLPYIVLPGGSFRSNTGVALGDVAVVIYMDKISAAVCADIGPQKKIGEGSIRLHEALHPPAPDPCSLRQADGSCKKILNASIEEAVLFFVFPKSAFGNEIDALNLEAKVTQRAYALYNKLRGVS